LILLLAAGLLAVGAVACGGGSSSPSPTPEIHSQKGLLVAAAVQAGQRAQQQLSSGVGETSSSGAAAPGAQTDTSDLSAASNASYSISNDGLTVTGYGMAAADADSAVLELYFSTSSAYPSTGEGSSGSSQPGATAAPTTPAAAISEGDLQSVIDALTAAGVARSDIEFIGGSYYDPYYASATLGVTVHDVSKIGDLVTAATGAAANLTNVYLQSSYVSYTMADCSALEATALREAVSDADARSTALASALNVTRGAIKGASTDAYSPYGGTACGGGYAGPYALGGIAYAEGQSKQVTVYSTVSISYALQ
jgi:uncharacterized protein YggE